MTAMLLSTACNVNPFGDATLIDNLSIETDRTGFGSKADGTAWIHDDGRLTIDGREITLTAQERAIALQYRADVLALNAQAIAISLEGMQLGRQALSTVFDGLRRGDPDSIGPRVEAEAAKIEASAQALEATVERLQANEARLLQAVPAFAAYTPDANSTEGWGLRIRLSDDN